MADAPGGPRSGERVSGGGRPEPPPWGRYMGAGLSWALVTMAFVYGGLWLDGKLGTRPLLTLVLAFVGAAAGLWSMVRQLTGGGGTGGPDRGGK